MSNTLSAKENTSLMSFPCSFPFKVMGLNHENFEKDIIKIIEKHVPQWNNDNIHRKASKKGKYTALTITFIAESQEQLDGLYREVTAYPDVKMVL